MAASLVGTGAEADGYTAAEVIAPITLIPPGLPDELPAF
jgi:hypothetical protein